MHVYIGCLLIGLAMIVASCERLPRPAATPSQRGTTYQTLENIDSLMWQQPDSAFTVILDFAGSSAADSLDVFNGHYCQLLIAELLFKNNYDQTNRKALQQAMVYFDSLVRLAPPLKGGRGDSKHTLSPNNNLIFLAARAHYINGAAYFEHDSLIEACTEYLHTLRTMESQFTENELVGTKARFMALTYNRFVELFSTQYMQELAIYCSKQSLTYDKIARNSSDKIANTLLYLGKQYDKLGERDSATYYYEASLRNLSDRGNMLYRDVISAKALLAFNDYQDTVTALDSLRSMVRQAETDAELYSRYLVIGSIFHVIRQPDSAKVYLDPVLAYEKNILRKRLAAKALREIAMSEGDTLKASQYAQFLAEETTTAAEKQMRVSQLNDLFQNYLQEKQKAASLRERRKAVRTAFAVVLPLMVVLVAVAIVTQRKNKKRMAVQEAEAQQRLSEASQRLTEVTQRHDEAERELQTRVEQATQHTREMLQQRAKAIYQTSGEDKLRRIMAEFETTYPQAVAKLGKAYPDLNETERNLAILTFLRFRAKEEAELLGLSENTVRKYRSALNKKLDLDQFAAFVG